MTGAVKLVSVTVVTVTMVTVPMVTVARFEWPTPTHGHSIFHSRLKKQAGIVGLCPTSAVRKIARMKQRLDTGFSFSQRRTAFNYSVVSEVGLPQALVSLGLLRRRFSSQSSWHHRFGCSA